MGITFSLPEALWQILSILSILLIVFSLYFTLLKGYRKHAAFLYIFFVLFFYPPEFVDDKIIWIFFRVFSFIVIGQLLFILKLWIVLLYFFSLNCCIFGWCHNRCHWRVKIFCLKLHRWYRLKLRPICLQFRGWVCPYNFLRRSYWGNKLSFKDASGALRLLDL